MFFPMRSRSGLTESKTSLSPPAMTESSPFAAPTSPPETGASIADEPKPAARPYISSESEGSVVVISTKIFPGAGLEKSPSEPKYTSLTSSG